MSTPESGTLRFVIIWGGQTVSMLGSALTGFALGLWVYRLTGSVMDYALIFALTVLPGMLVAPIAGVLVDRWELRNAIRLGDLGAGLVSLAYAVLLSLDRLTPWHVYVGTAIASVSCAFQRPAYTALTPALVPARHLGRANGLTQASDAAVPLIAPPLAGFLMSVTHLEMVVFIDFISFLVAITTVSLIRLPRSGSPASPKASTSTLHQALEGWNYLKERRGLLGLLAFAVVTNAALSAMQVLLPPLVLELAGPAVLSGLLSKGGMGLVVGSIVMAAWGGPRNRIHGVLAVGSGLGLILALAGLFPSLTMLGYCTFLAGLCIPIMDGSSQAIWQGQVAAALRGRVFAMRGMIAWSVQPLAYLLAGVMADHMDGVSLSVPAFSEPLALLDSRGRGIALCFIVAGLLTLVAAVRGYASRHVREVEKFPPDGVSDGAMSSPSG
ncbi:MFS transporter [Vitiosangium sp. GDMCC 1.1324]|uniref:MFS transporter n=1 Tax=Vitiosangium sp. (strain GDMCC 1.1324) TaxID=2138576 RepID=UPI000D3C8E98|nr:MFS transporter [Vitiosangium sp. GDMCC 1.1324]PTL85811.1 MFS transporter [Vitiosangium sp. GDMCC 1.1324]